VQALELRKQALVLYFCGDTIPFEYAAPLYEPVCLLAPRDLVLESLTRTYTTRKGEVDTVPPNYHGAPEKKRIELAVALGKEHTRGADAALLALIRGSRAMDDSLADAAVGILSAGDHKAARNGLPLLLAKALYAEDTARFPPQGQRRLLKLAARMKASGAAPVLVGALPRDTDLRWPRGIADTLGRVGSAEHADALLNVARANSRDVHFRREAARAFVLLAPARAAELDKYPELAIALAAARYELAPDDATRGSALGRLLNGLADTYEVDEAARYCVELKIAAALPAMESFLRKYGEKLDHPARLVVARAVTSLSAEG
jgi:hypothetical protein